MNCKLFFFFPSLFFGFDFDSFSWIFAVVWKLGPDERLT